MIKLLNLEKYTEFHSPGYIIEIYSKERKKITDKIIEDIYNKSISHTIY